MPSRRALLLLTVAAIVVRALFLLWQPATQPVGDERTWTDWARHLASEKVAYSPLRTHMIFYPPLYPYFLAAATVVTGSLEAARWVQLLVGSLLVPAVGVAGARIVSPRAGILAAGIAAFYPELVWFSVHYWSETLFMAFLWWGFERLVAAGAPEGRVGTAVAGGLLWGLAILTRETVLYFLPVAAAWLAWTPAPRRGVRAAAFLLTAIVTVAPWTYRNWVTFRAVVPVSTAGGLNLFQGNALLTRQQVYDEYEAVNGRIAQYHFARRKGLEAIRDRQPWWLFEKLRDEMPRFWEADSLALIHIKRGAYGMVPPAAAEAAGLVVLVPYLLVLAAAVVGACVLRAERAPLLLVSFLLYYNLIHVATHGFARYRLPAMPAVFLLAALGVSTWRDGSLAAALTGGRRVAAIVLAGLLAMTLVPSLRSNLEHPAFGFVDGGGPPGEAVP
jgi:4-amino-4-deoxy-L-arabinose transferase-like glycosyltransferase